MSKKIVLVLGVVLFIITFNFYPIGKLVNPVTNGQDTEKPQVINEVDVEVRTSKLEPIDPKVLDERKNLPKVSPDPELEDMATDPVESNDLEDVSFGMDVFRDLIYLTDDEGQPVTNDKLREAHVNFLMEEYDYEWSYNMKNNLSDKLTEIDNKYQLDLHYLECKSRSCELHGVFHGNREDYKKLYGGLKSESWWEFEETFSRSTVDDGGQLKIVTIITRGGE